MSPEIRPKSSRDFREKGPWELFGPEKPFVKLRPAYSVELIVSYVVKGMKMKITAKFRASRRLCFEDTKRIMSPEISPKSFGTYEKQAPGHLFLSPLTSDVNNRHSFLLFFIFSVFLICISFFTEFVITTNVVIHSVEAILCISA